MAQGISLKLPIQYTKEDGPYALTKTLPETVKQNLKNLVLTVKGERIMDPDFGVGLHQLLFENYDGSLEDIVQGEISKQVQQHMPFITIEEVNFLNIDQEPNKLYVSINYSIDALSLEDVLELGVEQGL
ncbi:MAG: hypothetical protein CL811_10240 [Colwelliaceae bacterium]|nr:hypothetical protein [Colwelliaceae bacterium]|tara:strand:- start:601 stop:987 length:387 start_codon:yes stop_codon:yes gene_type:complete